MLVPPFREMHPVYTCGEGRLCTYLVPKPRGQAQGAGPPFHNHRRWAEQRVRGLLAKGSHTLRERPAGLSGPRCFLSAEHLLVRSWPAAHSTQKEGDKDTEWGGLFQALALL